MESGLKQQHLLLQNEIEKRRSANYMPNIWKFDFLQSLNSPYDKEEFGVKLRTQVIQVKGLFDQEMCVLQKLELVDWINKLGLATHFEKEINETLENVIKKSNDQPLDENLYASALRFRLLRQHGYDILSDERSVVLKKHGFSGDVKGIVELLQASYLSLQGESTLEEAKYFAMNCVKDVILSNSMMHSDNVEQMIRALELPCHWRVMWLEVKWHIKQYQKEEPMNSNHILLQLAKLNFNIIQAGLQKEIKELCRWWKDLGLGKDLNFARNRLVESFMCAAGVAFEPKYKTFRKWLTKVVCLVLVIDDVYDIYASFEELQQFTFAIDRWDEKELKQLPLFIRICFQTLKDATHETAYEIVGGKDIDIVLPYLKKAWKDFCNALYVEANWYKEGYIPSLQEYLSNAWISSSGPVILLHSYFATVHEEMDNIEDFLSTNQDLIYNVSLVIRLSNDLATAVAERERGDAASSILCYMNEVGVSEDEARKHIKDMINAAWKNINVHCFTKATSMKSFVNHATNTARVALTLYQNGDGFGVQDKDIKQHILSLAVEPYLEV